MGLFSGGGWLAALNPMAVLGTGLGGGIDIYNNERNIQMQRDTNRSNQEMAANANAMNQQIARENNQAEIAMWERQTAYNSPSAQMTRLADAGLNPNLVYGTMAESKMAAGPSLESPHMEAARLEAPRSNLSAGEMLSNYQQVMQTQMLNRSMNDQLNKIKAEAKGAKARADLDRYTADYYERTGTAPGQGGWLRDLISIGNILSQKPSRPPSLELDLTKPY